jgi:2,3-dihydroxyphenylpropionate 1,2-dioxygenase
MTVSLLATSHSPLLAYATLPDGVRHELDSTFQTVRGFVHDFDPDLIVVFAPDHYNGFFYNVMPPFCVCTGATAIGDYGTPAGALEVPAELASLLAEAVLSEGVDVAVSHDMQVDHGAVQPLAMLYGDIRAKPVIPVFINCVAPPFAPIQRVRRLGEAVGRYLNGLDAKVLILASGGLSHDPPIPTIATATVEQRTMLLGHHRPVSADARAARQQRVIDAARAFTEGTATIQDLAPEWDQEFLAVLASGELNRLDAWTTEEITRIAGNSGHEIRTWIAGYAAMSAMGPYMVTNSYYRPIKELIAGFAVTTVTTSGSVSQRGL